MPPTFFSTAHLMLRMRSVTAQSSNRPGRLQMPSLQGRADLRTKTSAAQNDDHRILSLYFGKLPVFAGMIGKLVIGEACSGNNVRSHGRTSLLSSTKHPVSRDACESRLANSQAARLIRSRAEEGPASWRRLCRDQQCRLRRCRSHHA
jgi:hypothetical protein